jgi:hypothetical protein
VQLSSIIERSLIGEKKMKTLTTTMLLSVMFLSAGAFAGNKHLVVAQPQTSAKVENVTVIMKNRCLADCRPDFCGPLQCPPLHRYLIPETRSPPPGPCTGVSAVEPSTSLPNLDRSTAPNQEGDRHAP